MIPIQLTIQGLYSYQEPQTIDFTQLTSAHLFGIFGSVGSGKSSILEAITFALYGKTDRLNLSGDNRNYNMMNLKSNELLIDFIFETGPQQTPYRAVVRGRRNQRRYEDVKTLDRAAYRRQDEAWVPIELEALEQAIGLSYDNFKRTIIIPQGQFQEFLQLGNKDRTQMMKELFNLGKYEFFAKIASLEGKNTAELQRIEGRLQQLGTVDPAQEAVLTDQLKQARDAIKILSEQLTAHQQAKEQLQQLLDLTVKRQEAEKIYTGLKEQEPVYQARAERLANYEVCFNQFKSMLDKIRDLTDKQEHRAHQIKERAAHLDNEKKTVAELNQWIGAHQAAYDNREQSKRKAEELLKLLRIRQLTDTIHQTDHQLALDQVQLSEILQQIEQLVIKQKQLEQGIKTSREQLPDMAELADIRAWQVTRQGIDLQIKSTDVAFEQWQEQTNQLLLEIKSHLNEPLFRDFVDPETLVGEMDLTHTIQRYLEQLTVYLKRKADGIRNEQKIIQEQSTQLRIKTQFAQYSQSLEEGVPCPLCGSVHHPDAYRSVDLQATEEQITKQLHQCEEEQKQLDRAVTFINRCDASLKAFIQQQATLQMQKDDLQKKQAHQATLFVWDHYQEESQLAQAFADAQKIQQTIKVHESALEKVRATIQASEKERDQRQMGVDQHRQQMVRLNTEQHTLLDQLAIIQPAAYNGVSTNDIQSEQNQILQGVISLETSFTNNTRQLSTHSQMQSTLEGELRAIQQERERDAEILQQSLNQLQEQMAGSPFESAEEIQRILSIPLDTVTEKEQLARYKEMLFSSGQQVERLKQEQGDRIYDAELHRQLITKIQSLGDQQSQKNQEIGTIQKKLEELIKQLADRALLDQQLTQIKMRAENIKTLKSLFKASGFVNYISTVYLQNLCQAANERFFQLTRQKLSLEINSDNSFEVRDFMNGGKTRNVKTLSGGQTFQAALSLALALADNIQQITASNQNFFFLDEGFGSLDKESLSVVFDTLKSLRRENRIVGVISHVEEMQQEIDVHLRIENHEERGSLILRSA